MRISIYFILISIGIILLIGWLLWYFYFNIYEVKFECEPQKSNFTVGERVRIRAFPLNGFGNLIKSREVAIEIEILNGKNAVNIEHVKGNEAMITFVTDGKVELRCGSALSLRPTIFEFSVEE